MADMPKFEVGDWVKYHQGTVPHRVVAVIDTGRMPTYDLVSQGSLSKGRRQQGVFESRLTLMHREK